MLSSRSCSRWTLTLVVVILSKHFWRPGYCNPMHICFEWCNEFYGQANIRWCHLQSHKVYVSYQQHLSQTAELTHADIAVGTRWSVLSRNLTEPWFVPETEPLQPPTPTPPPIPNTLFVMARKRVCIWSLWWLFHAGRLMSRRLGKKKEKKRRNTCKAMILQSFVAFGFVIHMSSQSAALSVWLRYCSVSLRQPGMSSKPHEFSLS